MDLAIFFKIIIILAFIYSAALGANLRLPGLLPENVTKSSDPRIINGTEANWNGTRYQVSVRVRNRDWFFGGGHICGGALIAPDIVLTAGHCIWNYASKSLREAGEFVVGLGNSNRFSQENTLTFNVTKISLLPTLVVARYIDDIAILFLDGKVPADYAFAAPIALNHLKDIQVGTDCLASGWGMMETGAESSVLMTADVQIIDREACKLSYDEYLHDGMLCAGYMDGHKDACTGDSGGPLVCDEKLVGIISFGYNCAEPNYPGIYTDVYHYMDWIRNETGISGAGTLSSMGILVILLLRII